MNDTELAWELVQKLIKAGYLDRKSAHGASSVLLPVVADHTRQHRQAMPVGALTGVPSAPAELTDEELAGVTEVADEIRNLTGDLADEMVDVVRTYSAERLRDIADTAEALLSVQEAQHELSFADGVHAVLRLTHHHADQLSTDNRDIL